MLGASSTRVAIILLAAASVVVACSERTIRSFDKVELHRSAGQSLVVTNLTDDTIHVVPASPGVPNIEIIAGGHWTMHFMVVTSASRDGDGAVIAGSKHNDIDPVSGTRYLTMIGEDWVLTAGPREDPWEHELFFGKCWFTGPTGPGSHRLKVAAPPIPGLPVEICP